MKADINKQFNLSNIFISPGKLKEEFNNHYNGIPLVNDKSQWQKSIYKTKELRSNEGLLDCGFICKDVEKDSGCNLILLHSRICYFGKASHTEGTVELNLSDATVYVTEGKIFC